MDPPCILGRAELEAQAVELLPARETLFGVNVVNVVAVNVALAVNAASIAGSATAIAGQQLSAFGQ